MPSSFHIAGYSVAELHLTQNPFYGCGCAAFPVFALSFELRLAAPRNSTNGLDFRSLSGRLSPGRNRTIAQATPALLNCQLNPGDTTRITVHMEFPMDRERFALLESLRGGGDVELSVFLEMEVEEISSHPNEPNVAQPKPWRIAFRHRPQVNLELKISRNTWLERVIQPNGLFKTHLIELPSIPLNSVEGFKKSHVALTKAISLEQQGLYEEAILKCRLALESFMEHVDNPTPEAHPPKIPRLKSSWELKLGKETFQWLDASLCSIKSAGNRAAHQSSRAFDPLEAKLLITVTSALLAYAARTNPEAAD